jgi:uncharacterized protein
MILGRSDGVWLNEPERWTAGGDSLQSLLTKALISGAKPIMTLVAIAGIFWVFRLAMAFTAELHVQSDFQALYDQAGIVVRIDAQHWVKAGIEFSDGRAMLASVLTDKRSDWTTAPYEHDACDFWLRPTVDNGVLRLQVSADGKVWPLMRLAPFPRASSYLVGPMACTPERDGLKVMFTTFRLPSPLGKNLHDLS